MPQPTFRVATAHDAPEVADLLFAAAYHDGLRAGLPPVLGDPRAARDAVADLLGLDPDGGTVATAGEQMVAVGWSQSRGPVTTIGPLVVAPAWRGRGIGTALLATVLERTGRGAAQVRLLGEGAVAGALGVPLRAGFRVVAPVLELALPPGCRLVAPEPDPDAVVRVATPDDRRQVVQRDARSFGARREPDVDAAVAAGRAVVAEREGSLVGWALGRLVGRTLLIGSAGGDEPSVVMAMVAHLADVPADGSGGVRLLVPAVDQRLVDLVLRAGFGIERLRAYLARGGSTPPPRCYLLMPLGRC